MKASWQRQPIVERRKRKNEKLTAGLRTGVACIGAVALAILAYSGPLGASPVLAWLPVNATLLFATIVAIAFVLSALHTRQISTWIYVPIGAWLLLLFPAAHYVPGDYPTEKFIALVTLTFVCVVAPFQVLQTRSQRVAFLTALALAGVLSGAFTFSQGSGAATDAGLSPDVILLEGANTISTARILGTGALILIAAALTIRGTHLLHRTLWLALGVGLVVFMFATGSRGPFSAMVFALAALIVFVPVMREARFRSIVLLSFGSIAAYWWASSQQIVASDRAFAWLTGERDTSTQTRISLWKSAVDYASVSPLGAGWGGFANIAKAPSALKYPHNLFLELYVEAGWIIATILVGLVLASMWRLFRQALDPISAILFVLATFAFINAMVSGDINDNRLLWMLVGVAWVPMSGSKTQAQPVATKRSLPRANLRPVRRSADVHDSQQP